MGLEIERRFLVVNDQWRAQAAGSREIVQGYLAVGEDGIAVRIRLQEETAVLTVKAAGDGMSRPEFEYAVPMEDAKQMLDLCGRRVVRKIRHLVPRDGVTWEIDVFKGANEGLVLAECELDRPDRRLVLPPWVGREVTRDHRYSNARLSLRPWPQWAAANQE